VGDQATFWTGDRRYSKTLRVPRWISAFTLMSGKERICNGTLGLCPVALSVQPARLSSPAPDYVLIKTTSPAFDLGMASRIFGINGSRSTSRFVLARRTNTAILKRGRFC